LNNVFLFKINVYLCFNNKGKQLNEKKMKSLEIQKMMNKALANGSYKKAYKLFLIVTDLRAIEGKPVLTMPNLEARFN
jgi:hypothetical protein